jgi:hypothetical protein
MASTDSKSSNAAAKNSFWFFGEELKQVSSIMRSVAVLYSSGYGVAKNCSFATATNYGRSHMNTIHLFAFLLLSLVLCTCRTTETSELGASSRPTFTGENGMEAFVNEAVRQAKDVIDSQLCDDAEQAEKQLSAITDATKSELDDLIQRLNGQKFQERQVASKQIEALVYERDFTLGALALIRDRIKSGSLTQEQSLRLSGIVASCRERIDRLTKCGEEKPFGASIENTYNHLHMPYKPKHQRYFGSSCHEARVNFASSLGSLSPSIPIFLSAMHQAANEVASDGVFEMKAVVEYAGKGSQLPIPKCCYMPKEEARNRHYAIDVRWRLTISARTTFNTDDANLWCLNLDRIAPKLPQSFFEQLGDSKLTATFYHLEGRSPQDAPPICQMRSNLAQSWVWVWDDSEVDHP